EVAPREVGALAATWLSQRARLTPEMHRLLVACGAGAGLAAVYTVPLGGAGVLLEVLVGGFRWPAARGSPLGREVAPREVGALAATWLSQRARLTPEMHRLLVACGAGAGLAAVY
ncbi:chloride channel protein, partial [Corynebacterium pseudodiphtheriticum]